MRCKSVQGFRSVAIDILCPRWDATVFWYFVRILILQSLQLGLSSSLFGLVVLGFPDTFASFFCVNLNATDVSVFAFRCDAAVLPLSKRRIR